ncbi:hypothetical protein Syun_012940 [Stephania yunnanensis]|uniref:Response regulatory domain-containing protein n=1 Tax=Stephania yunnanensis TaxID=152371 RepID=A0AAP0K1E6_9MAGN
MDNRDLSYTFVISVDEGLNALTVLRETKGAFDLVITDVHMPMMDGFALMEHIIREFKIPVISKKSLRYIRSLIYVDH